LSWAASNGSAQLEAVSAFISEDFLLATPTARQLYHGTAARLPVIDYHCHLDPAILAADRRFDNLAQLWVTADPYKHRAMRIAGVPERLITGDASDREKFDRWAATVPLTVGNPLYHWTALELQRTFGIDEPLSPATAGAIWDVAAARLREPGWSARGLLGRAGVTHVCTSDALLDDLAAHARLAREWAAVRVLPSLRADDVVAVDRGDFAGWLRALGSDTGGPVQDWEAFQAAVRRRLDVFARAGCRLSDHGLDGFVYVPTADDEAARLFRQVATGVALAASDSVRLRSAILRFLGLEYAHRGWLMQLHLGAQRHTSSRLRRLAGPAGGYATMGNPVDVPSLCAWFDELERAGGLPRVILYPLNPADFAPLAVMTGSFAEDGVSGKLQLGPAWWFNDHAAGMRAHLEAVASHGLLATFIGMTTDSRSLLSMSRHEYFRRVFCDYVGEQVERGAYPQDPALLANLVQRVCHDNAAAALAVPTHPTS
jgi:glucuronate isomerase